MTYTYDANGVSNSIGRLTSVSSSVSAYNYTNYDALGRATSSQQVTDGQSYSMGYSYDLAGNMTTQTYPSGRVVKQSFDDSGKLANISGLASGAAPKTYANSFGYTAHGAVERMRLGNGRWEHTNFNNRMQPTEIGLGASASDSSVLRLNYEFGTTANNGNVLKQVITVPTTGTVPGFTATQHFQYDQLNRLSGAQEVNGTSSNWQSSGTLWQQMFSYDRYGNRNFSTGTTFPDVSIPTVWPPNIYNPQINPQNNRFASGQSYEYDPAGNVNQDATGKRFAYDAENKQTSYGTGGSSTNGASYTYDGNGNRVKKAEPSGTMIFVYNVSGQLVAEYTTSTPGSNGTSFLTCDTLGSPRVITKANGSVENRHDYFPFGEEVTTGGGVRTNEQGFYLVDSVRQKFTQKERDNETGLDFFEARYYASMHGRFTSPDEPFADQSVDNPQSWNLYSYVRNNPLVMIDPTGRVGDYYWRDGTWSYSDGINDNRVYVLNQTNDPDGSINLTPQRLNITHTEFRIISNIVRQEGATTDPLEYLWVAHTSNNEATANNRSLYAELQTGFSSAPDKTTGLATGNGSVQANASRAGVIDVVTGGADSTGGARRWDGTDFLAWGLHSPNGTPHNKFEEFTTIDIPGATYNAYVRAQQAAYGNSVRYSGTMYTLPAAVFTNIANWTNGNFHYVTGARNAANSLTATGTAGRSIFWRF